MCTCRSFQLIIKEFEVWVKKAWQNPKTTKIFIYISHIYMYVCVICIRDMCDMLCDSYVGYSVTGGWEGWMTCMPRPRGGWYVTAKPAALYLESW